MVSPLFSCNICEQFLCLLKGLDEISRGKDGKGDGSRSDRLGTSTDTKVTEVCTYAVPLCCDCSVGDYCVIYWFLHVVMLEMGTAEGAHI